MSGYNITEKCVITLVEEEHDVIPDRGFAIEDFVVSKVFF